MKVETYRLARAIAVGLAAAALGTPSAVADPWGSDAQQQQTGAPALLSEHGLGQNTTSAASEPKTLAGPWYTPRELKALTAYSNASFAQRKAQLAGNGIYGQPGATRPDDRAGTRGPSTPTALRSRGAAMPVLLSEHGAGQNTTQALAAVQPSAVTIVEPGAFDWGDAGVGAAGAFGLTLLACGLLIVSRHGRRRVA
jgi:hypothetical protein